MCVLLTCSALISASEAAFFALDPTELDQLRKSETRTSRTILELLEKPKRLLATQLIGINFLNIGAVVISEYIMDELFDFSNNPGLGFAIQVIAVTFLILLFAEIIPIVYANRYPVKVASFMVFPLVVIRNIFWPVSSLLVALARFVDKRVKKRGVSISTEELSHALEITDTGKTTETEKRLLKGIVKFGNMDVSQIMKPRMDMVAFEYGTPFTELIRQIQNSGFSRVPVYRNTLDKIEGVLYIKDMLPYLDSGDDFAWQQMLREPFFVPENKMIDDLLREFQSKQIHLAIVVDEYGGTSGIVTLEDIIEEIVGEINDEFDDDDIVYSKLDDHNYVFEGKIQLNDLCRILALESDTFENNKGDADTLAGFILEFTGSIPRKGEEIRFRDFVFTIESADMRRIKRVKVTLPND
ncbi:MAG: gliding motility-associated protein GldE [Bacteroidota bacterium]